MSAATPERPLAGSTLAELHREARAKLEAAGLAEAALDARLLTEHMTGTARKDLLLDPSRNIEPDVRRRLEDALARRIAGEPAHRIVGVREFYGLPLSLSAETLEPRPDTEALVDLVLPFVRECTVSKGACRILDLGTGTGAIGLALLANVPAASAILTDMSVDALTTAERNASVLALSGRAGFVRSDWWEEISGRFDAIVSNPPYIPSQDIASLQAEVRNFDPVQALNGGKDGLDAYRAIAIGAADHLEPNGIAAVEIGAGQRDDVVALFREAGFLLKASRRDFGGHERALMFTAKCAPQKTLGITEECG